MQYDIIRAEDIKMRTVTFRIADEVYDELVEISKVFDKSMNITVQDCIRSVYDRLNGDPKAKYAVESLRDLSNTLQQMANKLKAFDGDSDNGGE